MVITAFRVLFCHVQMTENTRIIVKVVKPTVNMMVMGTESIFQDEFDMAMEMTTAQFSDFMQGRKTMFNDFYERVVGGLRKNERMLMQAIATYRDKNVEILSSPYLLDYTKFNDEDAAPLYKATGIPADEMEKATLELKKFIKDNCRTLGVMPPDFANTTPFRILLILVMRYFIERGNQEMLEQVCAYYAYSMFYTVYYNYFRNTKPRKETMIYVHNTMSNKFKIKQEKTVDGMLTYSVKLCANTYAKRIMDCTDQDIIYVIGQIKSRIRDFMKNIKNAYVKADKKKEAVFISKAQVETGEEGDEVQIADRASTTGDIERFAAEYTNRFFQKPIDQEIIKIVSKLNEISRVELTNALTTLRSDPSRIPEVKEFYGCLFYLYLIESDSSLTTIHSKKFLAAMDGVYRKGNSKNENIRRVKNRINAWLEATSKMYREVKADTTLNNLRRSIYQYFVFHIVLRH